MEVNKNEDYSYFKLILDKNETLLYSFTQIQPNSSISHRRDKFIYYNSRGMCTPLYKRGMDLDRQANIVYKEIKKKGDAFDFFSEELTKLETELNDIALATNSLPVLNPCSREFIENYSPSNSDIPFKILEYYENRQDLTFFVDPQHKFAREFLRRMDEEEFRSEILCHWSGKGITDYNDERFGSFV